MSGLSVSNQPTNQDASIFIDQPVDANSGSVNGASSYADRLFSLSNFISSPTQLNELQKTILKTLPVAIPFSMDVDDALRRAVLYVQLKSIVTDVTLRPSTGSIRSAVLTDDAVIDGVKVPKGLYVHFYDNDHIAVAMKRAGRVDGENKPARIIFFSSPTSEDDGDNNGTSLSQQLCSD